MKKERECGIRTPLPDPVSIFAHICAQRLAVECRHLISWARSSKYRHFMVTNAGKDGTIPECNYARDNKVI